MDTLEYVVEQSWLEPQTIYMILKKQKRVHRRREAPPIHVARVPKILRGTPCKASEWGSPVLQGSNPRCTKGPSVAGQPRKPGQPGCPALRSGIRAARLFFRWCCTVQFQFGTTREYEGLLEAFKYYKGLLKRTRQYETLRRSTTKCVSC